ncbi:hypothetical protein ACMGE5_11855 [Macrococcus equi]|uniref:hypothetical protein n=1 Tax=Macrococcus equi TaxID=3395462 RepID=UPI0039BE8D58
MKKIFDLKTIPGWKVDNHTKIAIRLVENKNYIAITKPIYKSHSIMDVIEYKINNDKHVTFKNKNNNNQIRVDIDENARTINIHQLA